MAEKSLTYSSIQAFKSCRKRYQFKYEQGLVPIERPLYFDTGHAIHLALENHYNGSELDYILFKIEEYFNQNEPDENDLERLEKWDAEKRLTYAMFDRYRKNYPVEPFEVVAIEKEFQVQIYNPETNHPSSLFDVAGKIDMLVKQNGKYWIVEHKTAKSIDNQYKKRLTIDGQSVLYIEAMQRLMGIEIQGVIYNVLVKSVPHKPVVLQKGGLSINKSQCTTPELYRQAIIDNNLDEKDYADFLTFLEANRKQYFYREYLTFPIEDLNQWRRELWDIQKDLRQCQINDRFYRNTNQCTTFGTCSYFDICSSINKQDVIESSYRKEEKIHVELETNTDSLELF